MESSGASARMRAGSPLICGRGSRDDQNLRASDRGQILAAAAPFNHRTQLRPIVVAGTPWEKCP